RCRPTLLGLRTKLQLAAEVVREHGRQNVELVRDEATRRDVVEGGVLLRLAEELLLDPAAVEEGKDGGRTDALVGDDGLVVEVVVDGLEEVELQRPLATNGMTTSNEDDASVHRPLLGPPARF